MTKIFRSAIACLLLMSASVVAQTDGHMAPINSLEQPEACSWLEGTNWCPTPWIMLIRPEQDSHANKNVLDAWLCVDTNITCHSSTTECGCSDEPRFADWKRDRDEYMAPIISPDDPEACSWPEGINWCPTPWIRLVRPEQDSHANSNVLDAWLCVDTKITCHSSTNICGCSDEPRFADWEEYVKRNDYMAPIRSQDDPNACKWPDGFNWCPTPWIELTRPKEDSYWNENVLDAWLCVDTKITCRSSTTGCGCSDEPRFRDWK